MERYRAKLIPWIFVMVVEDVGSTPTRSTSIFCLKSTSGLNDIRDAIAFPAH